MTTAQQLFVDKFVQLINAEPNLNPHITAHSPSAGLLVIITKVNRNPVITYLAGGSSVTGAGTFRVTNLQSPPQRSELYFSWTLAPGDTVRLNINTGLLAIDLTYNLPLGTPVTPGGLDYTTGGGGGALIGGGGIDAALHRRLVVMECGTASSSFGSLFALDPQDATGVPIPTFRVVPALPASGVLKGEAVYVSATRQGYAWDGTGWRDITASPIRSFASDAALQADKTEPVGSYAVASNTGNMYVRTPSGWRRIGKIEFATYADMLSYQAPTGSEAIVLDEDSLWVMTPTGWRTTSVRHFADTAAVLAWKNPPGTAAGTNPAAAHIGDQAIADDVEVMYLRTANGWVPVSIYSATEATIRASTWPTAGQEAIATDTGRTFSFTGTNWVEEPIQHYATEALLLAATVPDGVMAWADDTNVVFTRAAGAWHRLQGPQISVGTTAPSTPSAGDQWFDKTPGEAALKVWNGTAWVLASGGSSDTAGAQLQLPGYFAEDPSDTATANDQGGLAFRYYGAEKQLWLKKVSWGAMTPMMGDPANAGKACIADAHGFAVWTPAKVPVSNTFRVEAGTTGATWANVAKPIDYILLEGTCRFSVNAAIWLIGQVDGDVWIDWAKITASYGGAQWSDGGYKNSDLKASTDWNTDSSGLAITHQGDGYLVKTGSYANFKARFNMFSNGTMVVDSYVHYWCKNDGSIISTTSYTMNADQGGFTGKVKSMGIKASTGVIQDSLITVTYV